MGLYLVEVRMGLTFRLAFSGVHHGGLSRLRYSIVLLAMCRVGLHPALQLIHLGCAVFFIDIVGFLRRLVPCNICHIGFVNDLHVSCCHTQVGMRCAEAGLLQNTCENLGTPSDT